MILLFADMRKSILVLLLLIQVITKDIETISPDTSVEEAAKLMAKDQIRRLPVVENGELVGIVAIGDLAVRGNFEDEAGEALSQISSDKTLVGSR